MILLVNDANIFIDLLQIDLLTPFFQLQYEFHVADLVVAEIQEDNVAELDHHFKDGSLHKKTFDYGELVEIQSLQLKHKTLSIADCSCLFHAITLSANLLTGDGALRRTAKQNNVTVHGILWILDELVNQKIITKKQAYNKLSQLVELNPRLPVAECKKRLKKW